MTHLFFEDIEARRKLSDKSDSVSSGTGSVGASPLVQILDPKRRQNFEICLKGLGLLDSLQPLINTVVELVPFTMNGYEDGKDYLSGESLQMLIGMYPTQEEERLLQEQLKKTPTPTLARVRMR